MTKHDHQWVRVDKEINSGRFRCSVPDCGVLGYAPVSTLRTRIRVRVCKCAATVNGRRCRKPATMARFGNGTTQRFFCPLPGHEPAARGAA